MRFTVRGRDASTFLITRVVKRSLFMGFVEWAAYLNNNPENLEEYPEPAANPATIREHAVLGKLFHDEKWRVPDEVDGFHCRDRELMEKIWPEGTDKALQASVFVTLYNSSC